MTTRQDMKADARRSAEAAPKADPETAARALADAKDTATRMPEQPIYKTQTEDIAGENEHHDKDKVISEFDDPAGNTV
ncbi:MAG: hypothetical protein WBF53_16635 [Litorimonas sp.]